MAKPIELTGQRFGRLTVLGRGETRRQANGRTELSWNCRCDCGRERTAQRNNLLSGQTRSCGCLKRQLVTERHVKNRIDLTGTESGFLQYVREAGVKGGRDRMVECLCACGTKHVMAAHSYISGLTKSCGCFQKQLASAHMRRLPSATIDLTSQRFTRWTVVRLDESALPGEGAMWVCRCDCGIERTLPGWRLRDGTSKSCGCLRRESSQARMNQYHAAKRSAP